MVAINIPISNQSNFDQLQRSNNGFAGIKRSPIQSLRGKERTVFLHFLVQCNHSDNETFCFDGKLFPLKRGDWITSVKTISELSGLSIKNVRTALKNLPNLTKLQAKSLAKRATLLSLENIDLYLVSKNDLASEVANKVAKRRQSSGNQRAINNNDNKENKDSDKNKTKFDEFHFSIATQLAEHIKLSKQIAVSDSQIKSWANDIFLLEKKDLYGRQTSFEDIQRAIESIRQYDGAQFFPVIESGKSFRQKFGKIENFLQRQNPKSQNQQVLEDFIARGENDTY